LQPAGEYGRLQTCPTKCGRLKTCPTKIMTDAAGEMREQILRQCAASAPQPWYPSVFARDNPVPREPFDHELNELRLGGLVRIVDWAPGKGQGYALTPEGEGVLQNGRHLAQLRSGKFDLHPEPVADERTAPQGTAFERGEMVRRAVFTPARASVTPVLIFANVAVFAAGMMFAARNNIPINDYLSGADNPAVRTVLEDIGALSGLKILEHQWIRLLSCCFVHFGLLHLGVNMYSLYAVGSIQEGMWGRFRYLAIYLIAGVGGSCAMVINNPRTFGAGASGAVFGLLGSLGTWIILNRKHLGPVAGAWLRRLVIVLVLNLLISSLPGISASAHFGGFVVGIAAAVLVHVSRFGHGPARVLASAALVLLPAGCIGAVLEADRMDPRWGEIDWRLITRPAALALWNEVADLERDELDPLRRPKQNDRVEVRREKISKVYTRMIAKLDQALGLLKRAGPYRDAPSEEERHKMLERVEKARHDLDSDAQSIEKQLQELELKTALAGAQTRLAELNERKAQHKLTWRQTEEEDYLRERRAVKDLEKRLQDLGK
jgi:membrane associated rhomboid family serine protease